MADTDILTQLQTSLDQLLAQFYASLRYLNAHHSSSAVPGTNNPFGSPPAPPTTAPTTTTTNTTTTATAPNDTSPQPPPGPAPAPAPATEPDPSLPPEQRPDPPAVFAAAQRELARDLVEKHRQIQLLIRHLPGVESSAEEQEARLRELDGELARALREREEVEGLRSGAVARVEEVLVGVRR